MPVVQAQPNDLLNISHGHLFPPLESHQGSCRSIGHDVPPNAIHIQQAANLTDLEAHIWRHVDTLQILGGCHKPLPQLVLLFAGVIAEVIWILQRQFAVGDTLYARWNMLSILLLSSNTTSVQPAD